MILSTHGVLASQIASFDADAVAFFNRVTTAGGSLSNTEKVAVNQLVLDLKANSIWTPMKAIYPMVGASAAACAQNLKSSSFTGTFTATGWTFASTGVTPNGTSAYMDPGGFNSATNLSLNSAHISYYSRTNSGSSMVMAGTQSLYVLGGWTNYHANNSVESNLVINTGSTSAGFFMSNRTIGTEMKYQINGSIQTDSTSTAATASITESTPLYMGCQNSASFGIRLYNNYSTAFYSLGDGLTDTQASNFYTAVQAFQTTLARQV